MGPPLLDRRFAVHEVETQRGEAIGDQVEGPVGVDPGGEPHVDGRVGCGGNHIASIGSDGGGPQTADVERR